MERAKRIALRTLCNLKISSLYAKVNLNNIFGTKRTERAKRIALRTLCNLKISS
jgi:hypothetical protein